MKKFLSILMILALVTALFVSCSQDNVGSVVGEDLVSISFATGDSSRTLTVSREAFDENDYIWCYTAVKADNSGMTQGQTTEEQYVWGDDHTKTGLTGATIEGISQGLWNFTLSAYVPTYDAQGHITGKSGVKAWAGSVTKQPVRKGEANVVNVTVSAVVDPGTDGIITFQNVVVRPLNGSDVTAPAIWTGDKDLVLGVQATTLDGTEVAFVDYYRYQYYDEEEENPHTYDNIPDPKFEVAAGTYFVTFKAYEGTFAEPTFVYAEETIAVNVYSGLRTIISGFVSELSSYVQFGEPVANAVIEAQTNSVIDVDPEDPDVEFNTDSTQSTSSYQAASIPAGAVYAIKEAVAVDVPSESTLTDLALALNVKDEGSTDASATTTKKFDISLDAIVTTTNQTSGAVSVDTQSVSSLGEDIMVVALYIGKNLTIQEVWHDGTELHETAGDDGEFYSYDSSEGILTLNVNHFSPFSVIYGKEVAVARLIKADGTGADFYTLEEAVDAAAKGDTVKLLKDIDLSAQIVVTEELTLDLNGQKLYNTNDLWVGDSWSLISVRAGGDLTITGNGTLDPKENDCYAIDVRDGAKLDVKNGTFFGNITVIYAYDGFVTVEGGTFDLYQLSDEETDKYRFMLNCLDGARAAGDAWFTVTGGTFFNFNPADNQSEGPHTNYVPAGYVVNEAEGWYEVSPLTLVEAKDATCTANGNHTYWKDSDGNKYIVDAINDTIKVATDADIIISAHHAYVFGSYTTEGCDEGCCEVTFICLNCDEEDEGHVKVETRPLVRVKNDVELYNFIKDDSFADGSVIQLEGASVSSYETSDSNEIRKSFVLVGDPNGQSVLYVKNHRGLKLYNRVAPLEEKTWYFANITIDGSLRNDNWGHLILLTGQKAEIGFSNVKVRNFAGNGTSIIGLWQNQEYFALYEGSWYPTKSDFADTYVNIENLTIEESASSKQLIQIQSLEDYAMNGSYRPQSIVYGNKESYEGAVHISYSAAGEDFITTQINIQGGNDHHDGVHNEWFLNGQIMEGIPKTDGIYGESD